MQDIRRRSLSLVTALLLVLSLFTLLPEGSFRAEAAGTKYELWILGTQITSEKLSRSGFVYDPDTNTLTSENSVSAAWSDNGPVIEHSIPGAEHQGRRHQGAELRDEGCHIMPRQHQDNGLRLSDGEQQQRCGYPDRQRDSEHRDLTAHSRGQVGHFGNASE